MDEIFARILSCLPPALRQLLSRMKEGQGNFLSRLSEIRLRAGHQAALLLDGGNLLLPPVLSRAELADTLAALCGGSLYAHSESLRQGYLSAFGCRVGVAGRAVYDGGRVCGMADITSLCIRLPHAVPGAGDIAVKAFALLGGQAGLLIYSPPGGGKTTLLREFARTVSCGSCARRVALVDARGELYDPAFSPGCQVDVLRAYPLAEGIEMATRTLSPELIVCDEIGSMREAEAILSVQGCGVPLVASAHAATVEELLARPPIASLVAGGAFAAYIGIMRQGNEFFYSVQTTGGGKCRCLAS